MQEGTFIANSSSTHLNLREKSLGNLNEDTISMANKSHNDDMYILILRPIGLHPNNKNICIETALLELGEQI